VKPKKLAVFGQTVKIRYVKDLVEKQEISGDYLDGIIRIDADLDSKLMYLTLLHEAIHALFDRLGVGQVVNGGVEEIICDNIAMLIYENFELEIKKPRPKARPKPNSDSN